jgi:hypothetical protein
VLHAGVVRLCRVCHHQACRRKARARKQGGGREGVSGRGGGTDAVGGSTLDRLAPRLLRAGCKLRV